MRMFSTSLTHSNISNEVITFLKLEVSSYAKDKMSLAWKFSS